MAKILFAGGRLDSLAFTSGTTEYNSNTGRFDTTYTDAAVYCLSSAHIWTATQVDATFTPYDLANGETGYYHWDMSLITSGSAVTVVWLADSSNQPWLALRSTTTSGTYGLFYNSGTGASPVWTQLGSSFTVTQLAIVSMDMVLVKNSAGTHSASLYYNNTLVSTGTFTAASLAVRALRGSIGPVDAYYSQIMITEGKSTIGGKVKYNRPSAAGANSGWTGAFTDVNEAVNNDATANASATAGQRQTYAMQDVTLPSAAYSIQGIWQWVRAKNDGAAPANIKLTVRISAVNYDTAANIANVGLGYSNSGTRWDTDPSTSAAWTVANWNAAEAGFLSAT